MSSRTSTFPSALRTWRQQRGLSQQGLAVAAAVSQRHVSYLETGRSAPSRDMVERLADALDVPLAERDDLFLAAGYAPAHGSRATSAHARSLPMRGLRRLLDAHDPFPAFIVDGAWEVVAANDAAGRTTALFEDPGRLAAAGGGNLLRLTLHPDGLWPHLLNRGQVRRTMVARLRAAIRRRPGDRRLTDLATELDATTADRTDQPAGGPADAEPARGPASDELALPMHLRTREGTLSFYTVLTSVSGALDPSLEELHLETLLPASDHTAEVLDRLADR